MLIVVACPFFSISVRLCKQMLIDSGKISANDKIDHVLLQKYGLCRGELQLKLLGNGTITSKCDIIVAKASKSAIAAVEAAKGSVVVG